MLSVFVALDASGSMTGTPWTNAINSLNEYISGLQLEKIEGNVTVVGFNSLNLKTLVENQSIAYFEKLSTEAMQTGGMTPLYDAAGHVMDLAVNQGSERTVIVILTDGAENSSREYTQAKIKDRVEQMQAKSWEVIFLGANFDVAEYTKSAGLDNTKMRNFDINNAQQVRTMYAALTMGTRLYATAGTSINMSVAQPAPGKKI